MQRGPAGLPKWNHSSPRVGVRTKSAQSQQQIDPISKLITQRQHGADGVVRVTVPHLGDEPGSPAFPFEFGRTMGWQQNDGIRIHAGTDYAVHGGGHRSDNSIGDASSLQQIDCVEKQQRRFTGLTGYVKPLKLYSLSGLLADNHRD